VTIKDQLELVEAQFDGWAKEHSGRVLIATDPADVFTRLTDKPGGVCAFVLFQNEEKFGEYEELGMVNRTYLVIVSRGRGLELDPATNLVRGRAGGPPLFDLIESARQLLRACDFTPPQDEQHHDPENAECVPDYKGARPWRGAADLPLDAYELEFSVLTQLEPPEA
jgi:hypothetical protein